MAKEDLAAVPDSSTDDAPDLFSQAQIVGKEERPAIKKQSREAQMRALRRILGDTVLDIFPKPFIAAVEKAYQHWLDHPDSYLVSEFDSQRERDDSLTVMRAYAECAGELGYTVRTQASEEPNVLLWRVQTRRRIGQGN